MKKLIPFLLFMSSMALCFALDKGHDGLSVTFGNKEIQGTGTLLIDPKGSIQVELALRNRTESTLVVIDPKHLYLHLFELNDTNVMVVEVMIGGQHLCPFKPYDGDSETQLKRIAPSSEIHFLTNYAVPVYCTRKQFRYEIVLIYKRLEDLIVKSDSIQIEKSSVRCLGASFFNSPELIMKDNLKRSDWGGGIKTINIFSPSSW